MFLSPLILFFFTAPATTDIYPLSLHDALPICLHAHLGRLRADPELRGAWDTYHLIGDALRGQISPGIADRVVARLREEPTVLAPPPERNPTRRLGWYAMSAAASVAAVVFVAWTASPGWRAESQLAGGPDAATAAPPEIGRASCRERGHIRGAAGSR